MKNVLAIAALAAAGSANGQLTTAFAEDFEGGNQYTTSVAQFSDGFGDFWFQTPAFSSGTFVNYNGADGNYFAGMDLDGEGASLPLIQTFDTFSISGLTDLEFSIDLAEDDDGTNEDYDDIDFVSFEYELDGSGIWVEIFRVTGQNFTSTSGPFNGEPAVNGVVVTDTFSTFSADLTGVTGSTLALRAIWDLNSGDEDLAIDNVSLTGVPAPASAALLGLGGLVAARRRRA